MTDEVKLLGEMERGQRAKVLLESPAYQEAVGKVREAIHAQWAGSPIRDIEGQTSLRLMLKLLNDLEANIKQIATTGKLATVQMEQERTLKERAIKAAKGLIDRVS